MDKNSEDFLYELGKYDFANDLPKPFKKGNVDFIRMTDVMEKYFIFKISYKGKPSEKHPESVKIRMGFKEKYSLPKYDPDSDSKKLQLIYRILWNSSILAFCEEKDAIKGDTINSIATTLEHLWNFTKEGHGVYTHYKKYMTGKDELLYLDEVESFVKIYHTLGNFIPVPPGFNGKRAEHGKDYWHITLLYIYYYYQKDETKKTEWEWLEKYKDWLEAFGDWNNFIEQNYLQVYVTKNGNDDYGCPLSLFLDSGEFKKFSEGQEKMNQSTTDFLSELNELNDKERKDVKLKNFLINAKYCIEERTKLMIHEIKKQCEKDPKKSELRKKINLD